MLQDAFVRTADRLPSVPDEALIPWFYRVLRNAAVDRHRRRGSEERALAALARELDDAVEPPPEVRAEVCACVRRLAATLNARVVEALAAVDVDGQPVKAYAESAGLSASNAGVRLFRARAALSSPAGRLVRHLRRARLPGLLVWPAGRGRSVMNGDAVRRRDWRQR